MKNTKSFSKKLYEVPVTLKGAKTSPKPFPGAYPTRWCVFVTEEHLNRKARRHPKRGIKPVLYYLGKPNQTIAERINQLAAKDGWIQWVEFDQRNVISLIDQHTGEDIIQAKSFNGELWRLYYPFHAGTLLQIWVAGHVETARLKTSTREVLAYMPPRVSPAALKGHEEWLKKANIELK